MELGGGAFIPPLLLLLLLLLLAPSEALAARCSNGGTAVGDGCVCPPGHSGPRCATPDPASACRNGATAVGTACLCPPGFGGPRCQRPDPASACHNGATAFGTRCVCPPGFRGDTCREPEELGACLNGGTLEKGTCRCPPAAWGPRCECTAAGVGKVLYLNSGTGTGGEVAATAVTAGGDTDTVTNGEVMVTVTAGSGTDTAAARRGREATARPAEGSATTLGTATRATNATTLGRVTRATSNGTGRNGVVTAVVSANTDNDVVTTMEGDTMVSDSTDHDVVTSTDLDVVTTTQRDTRVRGGSVPVATTAVVSTTPPLVRNATAVRSHARATTGEGDTTVTLWSPVEGDTTAMEDETTAMEGDTSEGDTEATPMEGDTEPTPVASTVESDTVTVPPEHLGSHSRATSRARNTTATSRATTLESATGATTLESATGATTLESDATAAPVIAVGGHSRATTLKSDTRATTLESHPAAPANVTSAPAPPNATETSPKATKATGPAGHSSAGTTGDFVTVTSTPVTDGTYGDVVTMTTTPVTDGTYGDFVTMTTTPVTDGTYGDVVIMTTSRVTNGTTRDFVTSKATSAATTVATICLYLPHGSSPPAIVCHNGGVANRTRCLCPPGFSGPTCETPDPSDRCAGGSTAVGDRCICPPGRTGPRCASPDPATACRHGGTAVGTECFCPPAFSGPRCEDPSPTAAHRATRATPRSTRRTTTTTVPTTRDPCVNGGRWTGVACLCPPNTDGPRCEFGATTINLTAELGPSVTMMARVTNREFSEDMADAASPRHRRFAEEFSRTMDGIYRNVSGYRGIDVLSLSRGSVVVNFRVRLRPLPGSASLEHQALELLATANAAPQPRSCSPSADGLCFTASSARATRATRATRDEMLALNDTELCRRSAPANFSRFYFPYRTARGLLCITNCSLNVPGAFDCHRGLCRLTLDGPQCFCPDLPWYLSTGDRCQTHISKLGLGLGVGLGLGLTLLILLILCIVLTVRLTRGRRKSPGARVTTEESWPDGGRSSRVTGIYHVNGSDGAKGPYNTYKPSSEVAEPPASVLAEGAAAL